MFKCDICEKELKTMGGLRLHKYNVHGVGVKKEEQQQQQQPTTNQQKETGCNHQFRLLNPNVPQEQQAMNDNWKGVCIKCQTLQ